MTCKNAALQLAVVCEFGPQRRKAFPTFYTESLPRPLAHAVTQSANLHYGIYWQSKEGGREKSGRQQKPFIYPGRPVTTKVGSPSQLTELS